MTVLKGGFCPKTPSYLLKIYANPRMFLLNRNYLLETTSCLLYRDLLDVLQKMMTGWTGCIQTICPGVVLLLYVQNDTKFGLFTAVDCGTLFEPRARF